MVGIAQLVRVSDCGPEGRGFDPHFPPSQKRRSRFSGGVFAFYEVLNYFSEDWL